MVEKITQNFLGGGSGTEMSEIGNSSPMSTSRNTIITIRPCLKEYLSIAVETLNHFKFSVNLNSCPIFFSIFSMKES
jgi:hypothetical protein